MKKLFLSAIMAATALLCTSCGVKVTADAIIDWSVGFSGGLESASEAWDINDVYTAAFSDYGELSYPATTRSTGNSIIIRKATSKDPVNEAFTAGINAANNNLKNTYGIITTTKPTQDDGVFTVTIKAEWSDWTTSETYYLKR